MLGRTKLVEPQWRKSVAGPWATPGNQVAIARRAQGTPPCPVWMIVPDWPTAQPRCASTKNTSVSRAAALEACAVQLVPPSIVFKTVPPRPASKPTA